jgi:hypothetical protein
MKTQVAAGGYADFLTTYDGIAGSLGPCDQTFGIADTLAGLSLGPGIYCFEAAATLTGTLTLTGAGPWYFEIGTLGTGAFTATSFTVVGGNPCSAFWWVRQDTTVTSSAFQGTIMAGDITLTDTSLAGRVWATGAVTMTRTNIFGCDANGVVAKHHCNQGVGNGPEGCDPGNSNQGNPNNSNDELGGTPGNPGRKGGNHHADAVAAHSSMSAPSKANGKSSVHGTGASAAYSTVSAPTKTKGKSGLHRNDTKGKSK